MADSLFLQRVELSNFRVYGEDFSLSLPDGPGVTLISGPNGMGKTTFFDALEWGLTGEIRRFSDYLTKRPRIEHLTRFGAPEASHRVSLYFSDGNPIDRTAAFQTSAENIASLLKNTSWPEISDLYSYLSITHFLGQSSGQRFSLKKPGEQWQALRGPAGVDRLNWAKERIGSNATRMAFNRAIKEFTGDLEFAQNERDEWMSLLNRRAIAKRLTHVQSRSPEEILRTLKEINDELVSLVPQTPNDQKPDSDVLVALDGTRATITTAGAVNSSKVAELRSLKQLPSEHLNFVQEIATIAGQIRQIDKAIAQQAQEVATKIHEVQQRGESHTKLESELGHLQANQTLLAGLREAHETIASSERMLKELSAQHESAAASAAKYQLELDVLRRNEERRSAALTRKEEINASIVGVERRLALFREFETAKADFDNFEELHKSDLTLSQLQASLESTREVDLKLAEEEIEDLSKVESLQNREAAIEAGVSVVLSHLQVQDTECPVCMTRFEEGLLQAVRGQARTQSLELQRLDDLLQKRRTERETLAVRIARLQRELVNQTVVGNTRRAKQALVGELASDLAKLNVDVQSQDEVAKTLQARSEALQSNLLEANEALVLLPEPQEMATSFDAADSALALSKSKLGSIRLEIDRVTSRRDSAALSITRNNGSMEERGLDPSRWNEYLSANIADTELKARQLAASKDALQTAKADADTLQQQRETSDNLKAILTERQKSAQFRLRGLEEKWSSAGLTFPIETATLLAAEQRMETERLSLEVLLTRVRLLTDGYKAWLDDRDIHNVNQLISAKKQQASVSTEEEMEARLHEKVQRAMERLERATSVRELSERLVHDLQSKADTYSSMFCVP